MHIYDSLLGGSVTALLWVAFGNPFGIHGFIPGIFIGLILIIVVSIFTQKLPEEHIKRVWGEE